MLRLHEEEAPSRVGGNFASWGIKLIRADAAKFVVKPLG